ncbi:MAG: GNAT family N-acetyltransferase, partial [Candidatus Bipolaricaulota bacterium]|nr:GNAT family N-acetyltransferase [Candidatus Bipolaricaulota bacterium]
MEFRDYDPEKDIKTVARIWREIGWIEKKGHEEAMQAILKSGHCTVATVNDAAESMANTTPGTMRYLNEDLYACFITGVATSRVARRQGLAARLTAHTLALAAAEGAKVAFISVFDQGYYNQLGFGNGTYVHWYTFDPAGLNIEHRPGIPIRLTVEDWEKIHRARLGRIRRHGACSLLSPQNTKAEMILSENGFGL